MRNNWETITSQIAWRESNTWQHFRSLIGRELAQVGQLHLQPEDLVPKTTNREVVHNNKEKHESPICYKDNKAENQRHWGNHALIKAHCYQEGKLNPEFQNLKQYQWLVKRRNAAR